MGVHEYVAYRGTIHFRSPLVAVKTIRPISLFFIQCSLVYYGKILSCTCQASASSRSQAAADQLFRFLNGYCEFIGIGDDDCVTDLDFLKVGRILHLHNPNIAIR